MKKTLPSPLQKQEILLKIAIVFVALFSSLASYGQTVSFNISKTGPAVANPGDVISYTISYANTSAILATDVVITDLLPDSENFTFMSSVPAGNYDPIGNTITWDKTNIPRLASLGAGTNFITVTIRAGKQGVPPLQSPLGYYTTIPTAILDNQVNIQSGTVFETSAVVTTLVTTNCTFSLSEPSAGIKSATNSTLTYLVAITNNGNIYQQFNLTSAHVSGVDILIRRIETTDGQLLDVTPFLAPGETYFFHFVLVSGTGTKPNEWNETSVTATPTICGSPVTSIFNTFIYGGQFNTYDLVGVYKIDNPDPVQSGGILNYQIIISNAGDLLANYRLTETYPPNTTFISATPPPTIGNNVWDFPSIPAGNTFINVALQVDNDLPDGTILNNTISGGSIDEVTSTFTEQTTVRSAPDLMVEKISEIVNPPAEPGSVVHYTITYMNNGNRTATNVIIRDNYDEQYVNIVNAGGGNTSVMGEISWTFPALAPGQGGTLTYTMQIKNEVGLFPAGSTLITNTATILNDLMDSNINDNTDVEIITVLNLPDLKAEKTASSNPAAAGQPLTYNITISNLGDVAHSGPGYEYVVTDYLPAGTVYSSSSPVGIYDPVEHKVTWTVTDDLLPGGTVNFSVVLAALDCSLAGSNISNLVAVYSKNLNDANEDNNEFTLTTSVVDISDPEIICTITETQTVDANLGATYVHSGTAWDATATDNCGDVDLSWELTGDTEASGDDSLDGVTFNEGTTLITWTATDGSGNTASCSFTVIVNAFADLEITKIASVMGTGDEAGKAIAVAGEELMYIITVTNHGPSQARNVVITDDVSAFWSDAQFATTDDPDYNWAAWTAPYEYAVGNLNVDATVTIYIKGTFALNQCEDITNTANVSSDNELATGTYPNTADLYTIVLDETDPVISCPTVDVSYNTDPGFCYASLTFEATATDNCGVDNIKYYVGLVEITFPYQFPAGTTTVRAEATDLSGNTDDCTFDVVVIDTQDPVITCPTPAASYNADAGECYAELSFAATATDNCGVDFIKYYIGLVEITFPYQFPVGTTTVRAEATDLSGNTDDCTFDVVVIDTQDPVITCPTVAASYNADAGQCYAELSFTATATDNCGVDFIKYYIGLVEITFPYQFPVGTNTVRAEATDLSGNTDNCTFDVVVVDNQDPVITCPTVAASYNTDAGQCYAELSFAATATDNCGVDFIKYYIGLVEITFPYQFPVGTTTVRAEATDLSGNTDDCTFDVVVIDNQDPVITCPTPAASYNADAGECYAELSFAATATDNCGVDFIKYYIGLVEITFPYQFPVGTTTVRAEATDLSGNTDDCTFDVVVIDTQDPVITCPTVAASYNADAGQCYAELSFTASATDNCGVDFIKYYIGLVEITFPYQFPVGTTTVRAEATDLSGNTSDCTFAVVVLDNQPPVITTEASDLTVECNGLGNPDALSIWLASHGGALATDNCGDVTWSYSPSPAVISDLCGATGAVTVIFRATDVNGLFSETTATFTIEDTSDPVWVVEPADMTVECDGSGNTAQLTAWLASFSGSDVCGTATVTHDYAAANFVAACGATGYVDVEFTLTDACGNDISKTARFTIEDTSDPVWVVEPADMTVECDGDGNTAQLNAWLTSFSGSDVCGTATVTHDYVAANFVAACGATGYVDVEFTLTDACGNDISKTVRFTIEDTTDPEWTVEPAYMTVECDGDGNTAQLNAWLASFSGSDICGTATVTHDYIAANFVAACGATGYVEVGFTLTDACGNDISKTVRFTIEDTTDPEWTDEPSDMTVECDGDGNTAQLNAWLASFSGSDICGTAVVTHDYVAANFIEECGNTGYVDVEFTLTDACGNEISKIATFTIEDTTPPAFVCPPSIVVINDEGEDFATVTIDIPVVLETCGSFTLINSFNGTSNASGQYPLGVTTVTYTATDDCGLTYTCSFTVTVQDEEAPIITCPPTITVNCIDEVPAPYASYAEFAAAGGLATDNNEIDESSFTLVSETSDDLSCPETITRVYRIADDDGNFSICSQLIIVDDQVKPVFTTIPANLTVECDGLGNIDDLAAWLANVAATDNCSEPVITNNFSALTEDCGATGSATVTWTATDDCGNFETTSATFAIVDTTNPVWTDEPADMTVECDGDGNTVQLTAWLNSFSGSDDCGTAVVTHDYVAENFVALCGATGYVDVEFTLTDACDNAISKTVRFTIEDTTDPEWTVEPADMTVECDGSGNTTELTAWLASFSGSDICGTANVTHDYVATNFVELCGASGYVDVEFTLTDACGNEISKIARFTIIDTIDPEWTAEPADMTVECDGNGNTAELTAWLVSFSGSDICGTAVVTHDYVAANFVEECGATGYVDVEFTLTDACGNEISKTARFTIEDTTDPVWVTEPTDTTVECDGSGNTQDLADWLASFSGSDVCSTAVVTHDFDAENFVELCGATGYVDVEFTLTDACENEISKTARFTIEDTTDPVFTVVPQDLTVECDGLGNEAELTAWLANVDATDVCGDVNITHDFIALSDDCGATGSAMVSWTATDACGNVTTTSATFTIVDTTPPVIVCPGSQVFVIPGTETVYVAQNGEFDYVSIDDICGDVTASHNLVHTSQFSLDGYEFPLGNTEVIWTVTDECGNTAECSFIVTVYAPSLVVTKTAEPQVYSQVGEEITYTITVSNTGNATLSDVVVTDPLTGLDTTIETLLPGETVTFTEIYVITYDDLFNSSVVNTAFAIGLDPEDNEVTESDTETIYVILDDLEVNLVSQTDVLCFGDETGSAEIQIVGGLYPYTIVWYTDPEQTGLVATNLPAGTYVVMVTDALGNTTQLTVVITQPAAPLNITYQVTHVLCNGSNTGAIDVEVFGGTEPYSFLWSNGATTQNLIGLNAGTYSAVITDDHGCSLEFDATVTQPDALNISNISIEGVLCMEDEEGSIQFTVGGGVAPYTYLWSNDATTAGLVNVPGGEYWVVITDANGCELIYDFFVPYEVEDCEFRIPQGLSPDGDGFNDVWEINGLVRFPNNVVRIYNRWGTLVYEAAPYPNNWDGRPNRGLGSGNDRGILPTGTYFYVIELQPGMKPVTGYIYLVTD